MLPKPPFPVAVKPVHPRAAEETADPLQAGTGESADGNLGEEPLAEELQRTDVGQQRPFAPA